MMWKQGGTMRRRKWLWKGSCCGGSQQMDTYLSQDQGIKYKRQTTVGLVPFYCKYFHLSFLLVMYNTIR